MLKIFLYPFYLIVAVIFIGALGVASDVMQLTNFNILDFIKDNSPKSYIYIVLSMVIVYFVLVIIGFLRKANQSSASQTTNNNLSQNVKTRDVSNSTIIQSGRDTKK